MNNVHEDAPVRVRVALGDVVSARSADARRRSRRLMAGRRDAAAAPSRPRRPPRRVARRAATSTATSVPPADSTGRCRRTCRSISCRRSASPDGAALVYHPMIYGAAQVRYVDAKLKVDSPADIIVADAAWPTEPVPVDWDARDAVDIAVGDLEATPAAGVGFVGCRRTVKAKSYRRAGRKDLATWLYGTQTLELLRRPAGRCRTPGESERDFRIRLQQASRETRDPMVERAASEVRAEDGGGAGAAASRPAGRRSRVGAGQGADAADGDLVRHDAARRVHGPQGGQRLDARPRDDGGARRRPHVQGVAGHRPREGDGGAVDEAIAKLDEQFKAEADALGTSTDPLTEALETLALKPTRRDVAVRLVALAWAPCWRDRAGAVHAGLGVSRGGGKRGVVYRGWSTTPLDTPKDAGSDPGRLWREGVAVRLLGGPILVPLANRSCDP